MNDREAFEAWWNGSPRSDENGLRKAAALAAWLAALASERAKQAGPLSMSMFATKADYDAALAQQAEPAQQEPPLCVGCQQPEYCKKNGCIDKAIEQQEPPQHDIDDAFREIGTSPLKVVAKMVAVPQQSAEPVAFGCYVQPVPDHCDRITWRGQYFHLPLAAPPTVQAEPVASMKRDLEKFRDVDNTECGRDWFISRVAWHLDRAAPPAAPAPCPVCHGEGIVLIGDGYSVDGCPACRPAAPAPDPYFLGLAHTLLAALKRLSFAAQTACGTAGRDDELVAAIAQAENAIKEAHGRAAAPAPDTKEENLATMARIGALRCEGGPHSPTGFLLRQLADEFDRLTAAHAPETVAWMIVEPGCEYGPTFGTENAAWSALTKAPPGSELAELIRRKA